MDTNIKIGNEGLDPKKWGPSFWDTLHLVAQGYPKNPSEEDKKNYREFYKSIKNILPCETCKKSYTEYISVLPIDFFLNDRNKLIYWIYTIHNFVNFKLINKGKKIIIPEMKDVYKKYENFS